MDQAKIISFGLDVIQQEISALTAIHLDQSFSTAATMIVACKGKVIISGIGKSGLIAAKIAATLSSTGTPSFFVHPSEASHGDLGMITTNDLLVAISNSGESTELSDILYYCNRNGIPVIGITRDPQSTLGRHSAIVLGIPDEKEADHLGMIPTTSTTSTLVLGDALAITCSRMREFQAKDFKNFHPGGKLGRQFLLVGDIMQQADACVDLHTSVQDAVDGFVRSHLGMVAVCDEGRLCGVITDGDLRRNFFHQPLNLDQIMTRDPITVARGDYAVDVLHQMNHAKISCVPVCEDGRVIGFLHIHDCLKAGL